MLESHLAHNDSDTILEPQETGFFDQISSEPIQDEYDFVVVGGGSSGCVVASRLSENPNVTVLLLEAGCEHNILEVNAPIMYGFLQLTDKDWQFKTTPQKHINNRTGFWPRGRILGGCSSSNATIYCRGSPALYDSWAAGGATGWDYKSLLPLFKKSEDCKVPNVKKEFHGYGGPVTTSISCRGNPNVYSKLFVEACAQAGIPKNDDYNSDVLYGAGLSQNTVKDGVRSSTAHAFIDPIRKTRKNLTVITGAYVTKIIFQGQRAVGVNYKRGSMDMVALKKKPTLFVGAKKEVIVSGGAINSPWLLMTSGVGPKEELSKHNIPLVADLPMGKNMQDHTFIFQEFAVKDDQTLRTDKGFELRALVELFQYFTSKTGLLAVSPVEAMAFTNSGYRNPKDNIQLPDLQIHFVPVLLNDVAITQSNLIESGEHYQNIDKKFPYYGFTLLPTVLLPKSIGQITLRSSDPFEYPNIDPNYLGDKEGYDRKVMLEALKLGRKIVQQPVWKNRIAKELIDTSIPYPPESDEYLNEFINRSLLTVYHPVGTCKMGDINNPETVVLPNLKIKGLSGIRVIDCSVCPTIPNANTNAPAIVIGEKGADMIKAEYGL